MSSISVSEISNFEIWLKENETNLPRFYKFSKMILSEDWFETIDCFIHLIDKQNNNSSVLYILHSGSCEYIILTPYSMLSVSDIKKIYSLVLFYKRNYTFLNLEDEFQTKPSLQYQVCYKYSYYNDVYNKEIVLSNQFFKRKILSLEIESNCNIQFTLNNGTVYVDQSLELLDLEQTLAFKIFDHLSFIFEYSNQDPCPLKTIQSNVKNIKEMVTSIYYSPFMPGAIEAQEHFKSLNKSF
jgi:hypothetical protein